MSRFIIAVAMSAIAFSAHCVRALPVLVSFSGTVSQDGCPLCTGSNPFMGFFSVGDSFEGTIQYDAQTVSITNFYQDATGTSTTFVLPGSSMSVSINGTTLKNDQTEPLISYVGSFPTFSVFNIQALLVPHTDSGLPQQPGPHGITELRFALQDNAGIAFGQLYSEMPDANSPIYSANVKQFDFIADAGGYCSLGACVGSLPEDVASTTVGPVTATVPEPAAITVAILAISSIYCARTRWAPPFALRGGLFHAR